MKIGRVTISNFKSILKTTFEVKEGLLALAGGNETGKSNVLLAIDKFLNHIGFEDEDKCQLALEEPSIELEFRDLTPDQSKNLSELIGVSNLTSLTVNRVGSEYKIVAPVIKIKLPEVAHQTNPSNSPSPADGGEQPEPSSDVAPVPSAENLPITEDQPQAQEQVKPMEPPAVPAESEEELVNKITNKVLAYIPKSVLISSLEDLIEGDKLFMSRLKPIYSDKKGTSKKYEIMRKFLRLGDIKDEDLSIEDLTKRNSILNKKFGRISTMLSNSWTQEKVMIRSFSSDKELTIQFMDCTNVPDHDDSSTWVWTLPNNRSNGFRWYITFYSLYLYGISQSENVIFLIDDGGAFLNKIAQENLLSEFKKISSEGKDVQILYTTHSKYMVDWNFKSQIYCVTKRPGLGTDVVPRWWEKFSGNELPAPLSELGVTWAEDYLNHDSLILEGYVDTTILYTLERIFGSQLHKNAFFGFWLLPGHGANEPSMIQMGQLCKILGHKEYLVFDSDTIGTHGKSDATAAGLTCEDMGTLGNTVDFSFITTEDLIPVDNYKSAVNLVGKREFSEQWDEIETLQRYKSIGLVEAIKIRMREGMGIDSALVKNFFFNFKPEIAKRAVDSINIESYSKEQREAVVKLFNTLYERLSTR